MAGNGRYFPRNPDTLEEQFWMRVDKSGGPDACWPWMASTTHFGYGNFSYKAKVMVASRVAYELTNGPLAEGLCALHTCDNPPCCNPRHLFAGTRPVNNADRAAKGRNADTRGQRNPSAKLEWEQVREMRNEHVIERVPAKQLAKDYGVSYHTAIDIVHNESWFDPEYTPLPRRGGGRKKVSV